MNRAGLLRVLGFAVAAVLIEGWVASDPAKASCGDYVMVGGHGHGTHHDMPGVPTCHGPSCRNRTPLPALPSKGLPVTVPADLAYWFATDRSTRPPVCGELFEQHLVLSEGHSLPLLRPPCL
ncbi:MAG: hypothetical protein ACREHD_25085 [Pirellulales bacterium]